MKLTLTLLLTFTTQYFCFAQTETEVEDTSDQNNIRTSRLRSTKFLIYPNPAVDYFTIKTDLAEETEVFIYNNRGQKQEFNPIVTPTTIEVDVSNFDSGNYYIAIKNVETSETKRLVIRDN